jgi:hypothetical protein
MLLLVVVQLGLILATTGTVDATTRLPRGTLLAYDGLGARLRLEEVEEQALLIRQSLLLGESATPASVQQEQVEPGEATTSGMRTTNNQQPTTREGLAESAPAALVQYFARGGKPGTRLQLDGIEAIATFVMVVAV